MCLLLSGCVTQDQASKFADDYAPIIEVGVTVAAKGLIEWFEQNPEKSAEVKADILRFTVLVDELILQGKYDPATITSSLKVKEPEVQEILKRFTASYSFFYNELKKQKYEAVAAKYLHIAAEGLKGACR